jgi:hypothetical protein
VDRTLDRTLGIYRAFAAIDLRAAQHQRRLAARACNPAIRAAAIQTARYFLAKVRYHRLRREAALREE